MRRSRFAIAAVLFLSTVALSPHAVAQGEAKPAAGEPAAKPLPRERDIVDGTCKTPRAAWVTHLYWSARGDFSRATACFDKTGLSNAKAAELAERLFDHLNANALFIDTKHRPAADPNYIDPETGEHAYLAAAAPKFDVRKDVETGRWLFSPEALAAVPGFALGKRLSRRLPSWFQNKFLGVPVWSYLGIVLLLFVGFLAQRLTVFVIRRYLRKWATGRLKYLDQVIERADRPIGGLSMAWVFHVGVPLLAFPLRVAEVATVATKALAAFSLVWLAYRLIDVLGAWMMGKAEHTESKLDDQLVPLVNKTLKVFVSVLGGIFVLQNLNVNVSSLLAGVGLGGLAFALAAKDTIANLFGSIMIFVDKPFQIGDSIVVEGVEGTIEEVGFRTTRIRTFYDSQITVPNSIIAGNMIDNYGARSYRRYRTVLGLTYDTPAEKVQAFCEGVRAIISRLPNMRRDKYNVEFQGFGDSALEVLLNCFVDTGSYDVEMRTRSALNMEIMRLAEALGIGFAFPTQTVHVESMVAPGTAPADHDAPPLTELKGVVETFADGGDAARSGFEITSGYDPS